MIFSLQLALLVDDAHNPKNGACNLARLSCASRIPQNKIVGRLRDQLSRYIDELPILLPVHQTTTVQRVLSAQNSLESYDGENERVEARISLKKVALFGLHVRVLHRFERRLEATIRLDYADVCSREAIDVCEERLARRA